MFIPDLQNVSILPDHQILAIGWLHNKKEYTMSVGGNYELSEISKSLVLFVINNDLAVARTRGIHRCDFCSEESIGSNAAIAIKSSNRNTIYITNFLLPHYIECHNYLPPDDFCHSIADKNNLFGIRKDIHKIINLSSPEGVSIENDRIRDICDKNPEMKTYFRELFPD